MQITNLHQAKAHLSSLVAKAYMGEDVVICKAGKPMARLVKYELPKASRKPGLWKGKVKIADDFDILPESLQDAFKSGKI